MTGKTLVIHAGTYKTGSSAIQLYLARAGHRGQLGNAAYAAAGRAIGVQHGNLTAELRGTKAFVPARGGWDQLVEEIRASDVETTIVSSEHFSTLTPAQLARIAPFAEAAGAKVRWIHYVREQAGFYNAFYVERLVTMRPEFAGQVNRPVEEFADWSPIDLSLMNYATFSENVLAAIPGVDLRLRPFSRAHLADGDVVADFCATAGIPHADGIGTNTNVGTGWRTVETARLLTPLMKQAGIGGRTAGMQHAHATRMRWFTLIRSELVTVTTELGWNEESAVYLTPEFRERLLARYAEENARVTELGGFDWPAIVAAEQPKAPNVGQLDDIPASELAHVLGRVVPLMLQPPEEIAALLIRRTPDARPSVPRRAARFVRRRLSSE